MRACPGPFQLNLGSLKKQLPGFGGLPAVGQDAILSYIGKLIFDAPLLKLFFEFGELLFQFRQLLLQCRDLFFQPRNAVVTDARRRR